MLPCPLVALYTVIACYPRERESRILWSRETQPIDTTVKLQCKKKKLIVWIVKALQPQRLQDIIVCLSSDKPSFVVFLLFEFKLLGGIHAQKRAWPFFGSVIFFNLLKTLLLSTLFEYKAFFSSYQYKAFQETGKTYYWFVVVGSVFILRWSER